MGAREHQNGSTSLVTGKHGEAAAPHRGSLGQLRDCTGGEGLEPRAGRWEWETVLQFLESSACNDL